MEKKTGSDDTGKPKMIQKTDRYYEADEVAKIAARLIPLYHEHLQSVPILYFFDTGKMKEAGTMSKRSEKEIFISGYKFVMQISKAKWIMLSPIQQEALVDHELTHAYVTPEGELTIIDHDIEEFSSIAKRYGQWHDGLKTFVTQFELFGQASAKAA